VSIIDASELSDVTTLDTDICIVGAGAAGITLATELASTGREICLVESGSHAPDAAVQALHDLESDGYALRQNYMSRARYFGGTCNLWAGRSMVLGELDFEKRSWVPHSGWPIGYQEVAKYYPRANDILRLPRLPEAESAYFKKHFSTAEQALLADPDFIATFSLWAKSAMRFGNAYQSTLRRLPNVKVLLNASVVSVDLGESSRRTESLTIATLAGLRKKIRARTFVLACGGLENARLLLVSRDRMPAGVGNEHDNVGRFFMDHPRAVFGKLHVKAEQRLSLLRGRPVADGKFQVGIGLSPLAQQRDRLLNHYVTFELQTSGYTEAKYQSFVQTMKVVMRRGYSGSRWDFARANAAQLPTMIYLLSPKELMPHWFYRSYFAARELMPRKPEARSYVAVYFCEQPPDPQSRVTLSEQRDALGVNRIKLHWRIGPEVAESILRMQELLRIDVERNGVGQLEVASADKIAYTDASHHMGTTRMSAQPADGVVDTNCAVHGVENLYLAGSSVFPSAGHANPTLSIVALALRLAEHLRAPGR